MTTQHSTTATTTTIAAQENYSLRWNNHQSHILESFDALLQQNSLVDVTLVCADRSLRAHKVVLSACSPFFERVFNETPCKHPTIVLKDFHGWLVQAIVDFMYRGEIAVQQQNLTQLIEAGESLQVRGLITAVPIQLNTNTVNTVTTDRDSPMPRRKQARPRRRSGDLADLQPQDLSNGGVKCENDDEINDTTTDDDDDHPNNDEIIHHHDDDDIDDDLHLVSKRMRQQNGHNLHHSHINSSHSDNDMINDEIDDDDEMIHDDDEIDDDVCPSDGEEKENQPDCVSPMAASTAASTAADLPQNLCTKKSPSGGGTIDSESIVNDKNNNNDGSSNGSKKRPSALPPHDFHERFILSLKDLRHLNRYRQGPPPGHPFNDLLSHLPISPPPSFQMQAQHDERRSSSSKDERQMKIESDRSDAETPPFPDQIDLAQHHANFQAHAQAQHEKNIRENHQKMASAAAHLGIGPPFPPPPFQQNNNDGSMRGGPHQHHQSHSPFSQMQMPSVSALTLTPPHSKCRIFLIF